MATYPEHASDLEPAEWYETDRHASDCSCDLCTETYEPDFDDTPSQADIDRRYSYFIQRERVG